MTMILIIFILIVLAITLGIMGFYYCGLWKLFKKAGKNGWEALIPFYNTWILAEISGTAWWYALIVIVSGMGVFSNNEFFALILSLASIVANFFIYYNLCKKFHKDLAFAILMYFFPTIVIPIVGFDKDLLYDENVVVSENGPIGASHDNNTTTNTYNYDNNDYCSNNNEGKTYCIYCGRQLNNDSKFCGYCGNEAKK